MWHKYVATYDIGIRHPFILQISPSGKDVSTCITNRLCRIIALK